MISPILDSNYRATTTFIGIQPLIFPRVFSIQHLPGTDRLISSESKCVVTFILFIG